MCDQRPATGRAVRTTFRGGGDLASLRRPAAFLRPTPSASPAGDRHSFGCADRGGGGGCNTFLLTPTTWHASLNACTRDRPDASHTHRHALVMASVLEELVLNTARMLAAINPHEKVALVRRLSFGAGTSPDVLLEALEEVAKLYGQVRPFPCAPARSSAKSASPPTLCVPGRSSCHTRVGAQAARSLGGGGGGGEFFSIPTARVATARVAGRRARTPPVPTPPFVWPVCRWHGPESVLRRPRAARREMFPLALHFHLTTNAGTQGIPTTDEVVVDISDAPVLGMVCASRLTRAPRA